MENKFWVQALHHHIRFIQACPPPKHPEMSQVDYYAYSSFGCRPEVVTLYRLADAGVRVPQPYQFMEGVLLMELVTDAYGDAAPSAQ